MADQAPKRRSLPTLTFYTCPTHGRYLYVRHNQPNPAGRYYSYEPTQPGQVAIEAEVERPNPEGRGHMVCSLCRSPLAYRSITDRGYEGERTECGPKCMGATGPSCDCKCRGMNHGAAS